MEEIKFPLSFTQCPVCGSIRRVANEILNSEKEKGKVGLEISAFLFQHQSLIADARKTILSAPMITSMYDVCVDCGTVYCIHVQVGTAVPGAAPGKPPSGSGFSLS